MVIKAHIKKLKPYKPPLEGRNPHKYVLLDFNERTMEVPDFVKTALKDFIDNGGLQKPMPPVAPFFFFGEVSLQQQPRQQVPSP